MKINVGFLGKWFAVACEDDTKQIKWLISEVVRRAKDHFALKDLSVPTDLTSSDGFIVYGSEDRIWKVLNENQFIIAGKDDIPPPYRVKEDSNVMSGYPATQHKTIVTLDGKSLTTESLYKLSTGEYAIEISKSALKKVKASRDVVDQVVKEKRVVYGINTGFGSFARTVIDEDQLEQLQVNLIMSHAAGVGNPLPPSRVRMLMALRINVLCKGYSGISLENLNIIVDAYNNSCLPYVPEKGTVGASGDLAPLAHMSLGLLGKGRMWSPKTGWGNADLIMKAHGIEPLQLKSKEGLAMINGTQFIASLGSEAVERARIIALQADVVAALTLEGLRGTSKAFDKRVHAARPHKGQNDVARRLRVLLQYNGEVSEITESHKSCTRVQDSYTLRCCPQVHGIAHDTIDYVASILNTELNSATDNPMVMAEQGDIVSCGNFHGEYPSKALDYLAIGVHEIGAISERRIERLCNHTLSELPAFLVKAGGLNSGFMLAHVTAASLVSENKCLCHPSSVDSLSTSAAQEDHVSMGGWAARKAIQVVEHVEHIVAIELLCACQAIDFHRPLHTTETLEEVHKTVRQVVAHYDKDRVMATDIEAATKLLREGAIWNAVSRHLE